MDQFIAAVELLRHPELAGLPVVVGGAGDPTQRSVVATASYAAREFGVHSGMPMRTALKKCPDAVFLPADNPAYEAASAEVQDVLRSFDVVVEVLGWDEAFLGAETADPELLAREIQAAVLAETRLHCSIGIGDNTLRAKLATEFGKPAGIFRLTADNWESVMFDRPTRALWGIGAKTARKLDELGLHTVRRAGRRPIRPSWPPGSGPSTGPWMVQLALGERPAHRHRNSVGAAVAQPGDHVPAEPDRLGGRPPRDSSALTDRRAPGRAGRRAAGRPGRRQGAVRAVLHRDPQRDAEGADRRSRRPGSRGARGARALRPRPRRSGCSGSAPSSPTQELTTVIRRQRLERVNGAVTPSAVATAR